MRSPFCAPRSARARATEPTMASSSAYEIRRPSSTSAARGPPNSTERLKKLSIVGGRSR